MAKAFKSVLTEDDLVFSGGAALSTDSYREIGRYTVPARTVAGFGYGEDGSPRQGTLFMDLETATAGTKVNGDVRLVHADPNYQRRQVVWEGRTEDLNNGLNDPRLREKLEGQLDPVGEDGYLIVEVKGDAAQTVHQGNSTIIANIYKIFQ